MEPSGCKLVVSGHGGDAWGLAFELTNGTPEPVVLDTFEPFVVFDLVVRDGDREVPLERPVLDIPVQARTHTIEPGASLRLQSPIRLRVAAGASPSGDRFEWTADADPASLVLEARPQLPDPFAGPCRAKLP